MFNLIFLVSVVILSCGQVSSNPLPETDPSTGKIVGGFKIKIGQAPYQVSVRNYGSHTCGGSIISSRYILTAGHCTYGSRAEYMSVRVGSTTYNSGGQIIKVKKIINHPQFNIVTIDYDFAILELETEITFSETQQPIELVEQDEETPAGTNCKVSGWGSTSKPESRFDLRMAIIPIVNQLDCKKSYRQFSDITPRMICAGFREGGKDSCQGDSGGPLAHAFTNKLVGVVSWGYGCALPNYPGVYARVATARNWIREQTGV